VRDRPLNGQTHVYGAIYFVCRIGSSHGRHGNQHHEAEKGGRTGKHRATLPRLSDSRRARPSKPWPITPTYVIIAEITPANPNVFYELGHSHATEKPAILLAERGRPLPFDVSGFRVIFYDDSIGGKRQVEDELRRHLKAIR
jgi:hypothetical protein